MRNRTEIADRAAITQTKEVICKLIAFYGNGTSFAEVDRALEHARIDYRGGYAVSPGALSDRNIHVWFDWNASTITALAELLDGLILELTPTQPIVYLIDGAVPSVPVVKQPGHTYKEPRWLPVTIGPAEKWDRARPSAAEILEEIHTKPPAA